MATDASTNAREIRPGYANYVLGVLFVVYVFNFIDRQLLAVFIGPIKAEFGASDTQMGLLAGFAFALFYTFAGIPIARWADRGNRRNILALGLALWSAMTVACGLAKNFTQLALARVFVGIGEAAGSPPSHSLIADYFPLSRRATALGIYVSGAFVGSALAFFFGGYLREHFDWRTAFIVIGAPGLLFALVVALTVREPARGASEQRADEADPGLAETLRFLLQSRAWVLMMSGFSLLALTGYAVLMWGFEFFGRVHQMSPVAIGQWLGAIVGIGGCAGSVLGGRIVDRVVSGSQARGVALPTLITLAGFPLGALCLLSDSRSLALASLAPFYLLLNIYVPAMYNANQSLARLRMRATAAALMLFVINIVGAGLGPLLVGALSDFFAPQLGAESIRYALLVTLLLGGVGGLILLLSCRWLDADVRRAQTPTSRA